MLRRTFVCGALASVALSACGGEADRTVSPEGLVGDGAADDHPALQRAIDRAERDGSVLVLPRPAHYYRLSRGLEIRDAALDGDGAELRAPTDTAAYVWGSARVRHVRFSGRNGVEVHGGTFEHVEFIGWGDGSTPNEGWAVHGPTTTIPAGVILRQCVLRALGTAGGGAYAIGLGDASSASLEDCDLMGTRWGAYVRSRSTLMATNTRFVGGQVGIEIDRKPMGYPGLDRFGTSVHRLTGCSCEGTQTGWDVAVPFLAGLGSLELIGSAAGAVVNNYQMADGFPPPGRADDFVRVVAAG